MGFPKSVCTSVNESKSNLYIYLIVFNFIYLIRLVVVHGIPNTRILQEGDSINVDITSFYKGYHGDTSLMIFKNKEKVDKEILKLSEVTREALFLAIKYCKPGEKISTIGKVIQEYVGVRGYNVVKEFSGHGVGTDVHMEPSILHFGK